MKKYLISLLLVFPFFVFAQTFDKDLYFGIQKDSDVTKLQEFLTEQGVYSGPISGNFFSLTLQGVKSFQTKQGIAPTSGYFGPKSRAKANLILAEQGVSSTGVTDETGITTPVPTVPPKATSDTFSALMAQIQLLQQQLNALQQQQQMLQTIQQQQVTQTQTLQQIPQNTVPTPSSVVSPVSSLLVPTRLWWDSGDGLGGPGLFCSRTRVLVKVMDQNGGEMIGQPVEITDTYTKEVKIGTSPFVADFGVNGMKEASFQIIIKSGALQQVRDVNVYEPNFILSTTDGRRVNPNYDPGPFTPDQNNGTYIDQSGGYHL